MNYETTSITQLIESILDETDALPRVPKKIKASPRLFYLAGHYYEQDMIYDATFPVKTAVWQGIPIEMDLDLFGYTYQLVYEEVDDD